MEQQGVGDSGGDRDLSQRLEALGLDAEVVRGAAKRGELLQLAVEQVLSDDRRYTAAEVAERSGLDAEEFLAHMAALGRPRPEEDERLFGEEDVEGARRITAFAALGLPRERLLEQARVFRPGLGHIAEAILELMAETALQSAEDETEFAVTLAELADGLAPFAEPLLGYVLRLQLRQGLRHMAVREVELATGRLAETRTVTVCFADLTGFTEFGERAGADELAQLTDRFGELAVAAAGSEVRLVKMLGDAAMLAAPDSDAVLHAAAGLVEAAAEDERLPAVHAGVARGAAIARAGDWYGPPVNRASRLTGAAGAGEVVADAATREASGGGWDWEPLGEVALKGFAEPVAAHRLRRAPG